MRSVACVLTLGLGFAPGLAVADGLVIPGFGPDEAGPRAGFREAAFPPPQHDMFGLPERMPQPRDRSAYRQASQFPPQGGRYGGGFIEYMMTGGRPEPVAPPLDPAPADAAPNLVPSSLVPSSLALPDLFASGPAEPADQASVAVNPRRAALPRGGLPDYAPQPDLDRAPPPPAGFGPLSFFGGGADAPQPAAYAPDGGTGLAAGPSNPAYQRQLVGYSGRERPGTVVIDTPDKFLYLVQGDGRAIRYGIGVGRPGFRWAGVKSITRKAEWPGWTPPSQMLHRRPDLPRHMAGGDANPLGARALYLGSSLYRIHGTNEPDTIGTNVSSGCIRMMNRDVIDLYGRVGVGTRVVVL